MMRCKNCGWDNPDGSLKCQKCNAPLKGSMLYVPMTEQETPADAPVDAPEEAPEGAVSEAATVMPKRKGKCTLTLLPEEGERIEAQTLSFEGKEVELNRANTEKDNNTITSKVQAVLTFEGKHWYIQDKSTLKTTYVQAGSKIQLQPGDIVVLGDRRFEFND